MAGWTSSCIATPCHLGKGVSINFNSQSISLMYTSTCIYRAKTSIQQKLPAQLEGKLEKFVKNITALREAHSFPDTMIINMDEAPMHFDMPGSHTMQKNADREVRIWSTGTKNCHLGVHSSR